MHIIAKSLARCGCERIARDIIRACNSSIKAPSLSDEAMYSNAVKSNFSGAGYQPDAGVDHGAQIRLGEHAVEAGSHAPLVGVAYLVVADRAAARFQHTAVGQHHVHAAQAAEVVGHRRQPAAFVQRIAQHAGVLCGVGGVGPQA